MALAFVRANGTIAGTSGTRVVTATTNDGRYTGAYAASEVRDENIQLYLTIAVDISPSMDFDTSGRDYSYPGPGQPSRLDVALRGIQSICRSKVIAARDSLSVYTFDDTPRLALRCVASNFDYKLFKQRLMQRREDSGGTAVRDAVKMALRDMQQHNNTHGHKGNEVVRYLLVFTDGEDNASDIRVAELARAVETHSLRNFHLLVITAGLKGPDCSRWRQICRPDCCTLIEAPSVREADIVSAFADAMKHLRALLVRDNVTREVRQVNYTLNRQGAAAMDQRVSSLLSGFQGLRIQSAGLGPTLQLLGGGGGPGRASTPGRHSRPGTGGGGGGGGGGSRANTPGRQRRSATPSRSRDYVW